MQKIAPLMLALFFCNCKKVLTLKIDIRLNFAIDDVITGNILDVSGYFQTSVTLMDVLWCSRKKELTAKPCPMEAMALNYLLLRFQVQWGSE